MKVCMIAEGCYPYVVGGVSSWIHSLIQLFPNIEFNLIAIVSDSRSSGKFAYTLPANLTVVEEIYLQDVDWTGRKRRGSSRIRLSEKEYQALRSLVIGENVDWKTVFSIFQSRNISVNNLLMGPDFLRITQDFYRLRFPNINFSDFLWTLRSIYLPLFFTLRNHPPRADIYHCVSTGYAGIIGSCAKMIHKNSMLIISEHGIYTREREEEIIKAKWVQGIYKSIWIEQFRKMSQCAYIYANLVTSLFGQARSLQLELGCPPEKAIITPNGIRVEDYDNIPKKDPEDPYINVGAVLRVTPIKDVKTLINAFYFAHKKNPLLKLWIMGSADEDKEYAEACYRLVESLNAQNILFTGRIKTTDYLGKMDMTILTSISEGQPLTILEGFAAKKPCVATNVGNCYGLIYGETDDFGSAGIVVPVMSISGIAEAILTLASDRQLREEMGLAGYRRLMAKYKSEYMVDTYRSIYRTMAGKAGISYPESAFVPPGRANGKER